MGHEKTNRKKLIYLKQRNNTINKRNKNAHTKNIVNENLENIMKLKNAENKNAHIHKKNKTNKQMNKLKASKILNS